MRATMVAGAQTIPENGRAAARTHCFLFPNAQQWLRRRHVKPLLKDADMNTPSLVSLLFLAVLPMLLMTCAPASERPAPAADPQEITAVVKAENGFAVDLYRQLAAKSDEAA